MKVLGIDPGLQSCGYGLVESGRDKALRYIDSGTISPPLKLLLPQRLKYIYSEITSIIDKHLPTCLSLEGIFFSRNVKSAIKLGEVRAVIMLAAANKGLEVYEYAPAKVKLAITGNGRAGKREIKKMLDHFLGPRLSETISSTDSSDAVAIALCHINSFNAFFKADSVLPRKKRRTRFKLNDFPAKRKID